MSEHRTPEETIAEHMAGIRDNELYSLLDAVTRIADGVGSIYELVVKVTPDAPPAPAGFEAMDKRAAVRYLESLVYRAEGTPAIEVVVPLQALAIVLGMDLGSWRGR